MRYAQKTNQRRISKSLEGQSANVIGQKVQKIAIFGWYIDREFWNDRRELVFWKWSSFFPRKFLSENLPAILDWFTIRFSCLLLIQQLETHLFSTSCWITGIFFRGNTFTDKRFSQTPQNLNFTRNSGYKALSRGQWAWRLADKITIVFSSHTKTLILWPSIWHDTTKPEAVLVAYHWANFWGAVSFRQVLTNGAASSKACDLELVLTSKLVPCTLPVNSRPFTKRQLISWSQKLFYFH